MTNAKRKPLAFISTSLKKQDKPFVDLVEKIAQENGFEPFGTVSLHSAAPMPVWEHMVENIPKADCVIMAATPRYLLKFVFFKSPFSTMAANHIFKSTTLNLDELFRRSFLERYDFNEYGEVDEKFWLHYFHPVVLDYLEHKVKNDNIKLPDYQQILFSQFYADMILQAYKGIGRPEYVPLRRTIETMYRSEDNDLKKSIELIPDMEQRSFFANHLGLVLSNLHLFPDALYYHQFCLKIDKDTRRIDRTATDYANIGNCLHGLGELDKAEEYYHKDLNESTNMNNKKWIARAYGNLTSITLSKNNLDLAIEYSKKALAIDKELNNKEGLSLDYNNIATVFLKRENYIMALGCYQTALSFDMELDDQLGMSSDYNNMGIAVRRLGDSDKALEYFEKALQIDKKLDNKRGLLRTYKNIVKAALQKEDSNTAQKYFDEYLSVYTDMYGSVTLSDFNKAWQSGRYFHLITE